MTTRLVDVAIGVLVERQGGRWRMLITRRPDGVVRAGWWEWPGGKVEPGETPAQCLVREFEEELGLAITVGEALPIIEHRYDHAHVRLHPFLCGRNGGEPVNRAVAEHRWVEPAELRAYQFLEANAPLVDELVRRLGAAVGNAV